MPSDQLYAHFQLRTMPAVRDVADVAGLRLSRLLGAGLSRLADLHPRRRYACDARNWLLRNPERSGSCAHLVASAYIFAGNTAIEVDTHQGAASRFRDTIPLSVALGVIHYMWMSEM